MTRLTQLPQIAEETLGGLKAGRETYLRISQGTQPRRATPAYVRVLALACSFVFLLGIGAIGMNLLSAQDVPAIHTQMAGAGPQGAVLRAADLPRGSIALSQSGTVPGFVGVWEEKGGANFPLLRVNGRYYRLLSNPAAIEENLLGRELGAVSVFTTEPALDLGNELLSNTVAQGQSVYALRDMEGAAVAARVEDKLRVFQRVSYAGVALVEGDSLAHTLNGRVTGIQLSGAGSVTDASRAAELMQLLTSTAGYVGSASRGSDQALLIRYQNGVVLQMAMREGQLSACGTWEAEDFLSAFEAEVQ